MQNVTPPISTERPASKHWFFWFTIVAGIFIIAFYAFTGLMYYKYFGLHKYGYEISGARFDGAFIGTVIPQGPAQGKLQPGDKILALNGDQRFSRISRSAAISVGHFDWLRSLPEGQSYVLRIEREGIEKEIELSTNSVPVPESLRKQRWRLIAIFLPRSLAFLIVALLIGFLKPQSQQARLTTIASLVQVVQALEILVIHPNLNSLFSVAEGQIAFTFALFMGQIWFAPLGYHWCYGFPDGVPTGRFWSFLKWLFYGVGAMLYVNFLTTNLLAYTSHALTFLSSYHTVNILMNWINYWYWIAGLVAISAVLIRNNRLVKEPDQRRRIRLVLYATLLPVLPYTLIGLIDRISYATGYTAIVSTDWYQLLSLFPHLGITLIPIAWGYAVLKRQLFDINVVIRSGVKYLLAKNAFRILLALPIIGVLYGIASKPNRPLKDLLFDHAYIPILLVIASLGLAFRKQLSHWIDQRFFREAYNQEQTLLRLIDEIRDLPSMPEMARRVSQQLDATLHPERVYVFYRAAGQRDLSLGYSSSGEALNLELPAQSLLLRVLDGQKEAHEYPSVLFDRMLSGADRAWLEQLHTSLVVPMCGADERLSGLLLLGGKKSEQPYSGRDRHLLESIARQMAVVYENFGLRERVDRDAKVRHEVLAKLDGQQINLLHECPSCGACFDSGATHCAKCNAELTLTLPVERTIDGKYRLEQLLGKGGMGAVYHATDLRLDRKVAVKIITGKSFGDQAALRRFEREARASAKLNHPNIVSVYDYGQTGAEGAYLVMEFIEGITLREELTGALPPSVVADWFEQLLDGMKSAHAAGVIHRDLKPENMLLTKGKNGQTQLKILDFGLAKLRNVGGSNPDAPTEKQQSLTAPGTVMGTLSYMSPEQLSGEEVDERGDIFALGVMVVEALTGKRPFKGNSMTELLASILQNPYRLPGNAPEELRLNNVLQKCLAKAREDRFGTIAEMQTELVPAIRDCPELLEEGSSRGIDKLSYSSSEETIRF